MMLLLQRLVRILLLSLQSLHDGYFLDKLRPHLLQPMQISLKLLGLHRLFSHTNCSQHRQTRSIQMGVHFGNDPHMVIHTAGNLFHIFNIAADDFIRSTVYFNIYTDTIRDCQNVVPPSVLTFHLRCPCLDENHNHIESILS
ncbi:hypothetical protein D3C77_439250 [compost metagenome]